VLHFSHTVLIITQEVDMARAANDALHRVFDTRAQQEAEQGGAPAAARSTLLSEVRPHSVIKMLRGVVAKESSSTQWPKFAIHDL
jgi:hypothetical protein